jgi:hypothetical protein
MVEVKRGAENIEEGLQSNPDWQSDHEKLAMLFLRSGDVVGAAVEFEKLSRIPARADAAGYAAACFQAAGDSLHADSLANEAAERLGISRGDMRARVARLRSSMPDP